MTGRRWRTTVAAALAALLLTLAGCATRLPPTEPLAPDEGGIVVDIDAPIEAMVTEARRGFGL